MMAIRLALSTLLSASAVWGKLAYRATPQVYDACINVNDIALTFDDGPYIYLRSISDQFTAAGAKATFFFNGNNWDCIYNADRISDVQYAYAAGHMIGSHTWAHADLTTLSTPQIQDAMFRMEEAFSRILGIKPAFMRPPYGDYNDNIQSIAAARGQSLALWDWDTGDADGNTTAQSEALYDDVANAKVKNALILEHETEETTASTLVPFAIKLFQGKGYNLVTMAQCLGVDPYQAIGVPQQQTSAWTCDGTPDPGEACAGSIACETGTPAFSSTTAAPTGPTSTSTTTTTTSAPTGPTPPPTTGHTITTDLSSTTCLSAPTNANGAAVVVEPCNGSTSQSWTQNGQTLLVYGTMCLDVTNGSTANGVKMQIWACTPGQGDAAQHFTLTSANQIQWANTAECLDLTNGALTSGNQVQMWACATGNTNQMWKLN
jgi:peptidoglycan/xylan/chitin deacetylase (PgdA/CDA1 family)